MLVEFGGEIDNTMDNATDVVVRGDGAEEGVEEEAADWSIPIIGVKAIRIRGHVKVSKNSGQQQHVS